MVFNLLCSAATDSVMTEQKGCENKVTIYEYNHTELGENETYSALQKKYFESDDCFFPFFLL